MTPSDRLDPWPERFGAASLVELVARYQEHLRRFERDGSALSAESLAELRARVESEHRARYGAVALAAERADERDRDAAVRDDAALVAYERKWRRKLGGLQRAQPARWRVLGLSDEEVLDSLTLRLIEAVRAEPRDFHPYQRPGKEWGLSCAQAELRALRKSFRLHAVPADFDAETVQERAANQEEAWLELEAKRGRALARERAERSLSRSQRAWLAALELSANAGAFFESSGLPNLSAASRVLGKDRSSAQRAYRELRGKFMEELNRLERAVHVE